MHGHLQRHWCFICEYDDSAPVIEEVIAYWATVDECDPVLKENVSDKVIKYSYLNGIDDTQIVFYKILGMGHTFPVKLYLDNPDISTIICDFFELDSE